VAANATGFEDRLDFRFEIDGMTGRRRQSLELFRRQGAASFWQGYKKSRQEKFQSGFQHSKELPISDEKALPFYHLKKPARPQIQEDWIIERLGRMTNLAVGAGRAV
jgi:hypothetical protein